MLSGVIWLESRSPCLLRFGPIGWNIAYEWMASDFAVSMEQLAMYIEKQSDVPYQTMTYIVAEVPPAAETEVATRDRVKRRLS